MVKKRRQQTAAYKFRIALEALEGSKTISQLSSEHEIHANLIRTWKRQLLEDGPSVKRSAWLGPRSSTPTRAHSTQPTPSPPACSLPLIIARMANRFGGTDYQAVMAGSVLVSIPAADRLPDIPEELCARHCFDWAEGIVPLQESGHSGQFK